jgi:hypothetical protein
LVNLNGPKKISPVSSKIVEGVTLPEVNPAKLVVILNVEPGGYTPAITRFRIGELAEFRAVLKLVGAKEGYDTKLRI